jgi:hypothetical protein
MLVGASASATDSHKCSPVARLWDNTARTYPYGLSYVRTKLAAAARGAKPPSTVSEQDRYAARSDRTNDDSDDENISDSEDESDTQSVGPAPSTGPGSDTVLSWCILFRTVPLLSVMPRFPSRAAPANFSVP